MHRGLPASFHDEIQIFNVTCHVERESTTLVGSIALSVRRDAEEVKMGTKQTQFTVKDLETMSVGKIIQPWISLSLITQLITPDKSDNDYLLIQ